MELITREHVLHAVATFDRANLLVVTDGMVNVWHQALAHLTVDELQAAVGRLLAERTSADRWLTPGDVIAVARPRRSAWDRATNVTRRRLLEGGQK